MGGVGRAKEVQEVSKCLVVEGQEGPGLVVCSPCFRDELRGQMSDVSSISLKIHSITQQEENLQLTKRTVRESKDRNDCNTTGAI